MHSKEWPLIGFTLAAQCAVGMVVVLTAVHGPIADRIGEGRTSDLATVVLLLVLALLVGAGVTVTLHLGNVRNVYLVLANWRHSWLSREVLMVTVFAVAVAGYAFVHLAGIGGTSSRIVLGALASVIGLGLVASIAKLYMLRTVPVWNRSTTPLAFFSTTLLLGSIGVAIALALVDGAGDLVRLLGAVALVTLAGQLAIFEHHRRTLRAEDGAAATSARLIDVTYAKEATFRVALVLVAALLLSLAMLSSLPLLAGITLAGLVTLASEVLGRYLFYASYARSGL